MDAELNNILVTGATRGVGEALSLRFAGQGRKVFALARTREQLDSLVERGGSNILPFAVDISDRDAVEVAVNEIESAHGGIDVLINNAGVVQNINFAEQSFDVMERIIDVNLKGTLYCTRHVVPFMIQRKRGRIINISSVAGVRGIPGQAAYCASKHGMNGFADALAQELIPHGIVVSTICPGGIDTPLWDKEKNPYPGDLDKVIQPGEIVDMVEFLLNQPSGTMYKRIVVFPTNEWH
jgi:3-oxoacyl-[acyl-carrier protein] reductase